MLNATDFRWVNCRVCELLNIQLTPEQHGLNPLIHGFFSIIIQSALHIQVLHPRIQRADCRYCSTPFYIRDLNIRGLWYLWEGPGTHSPQILRKDWIKFCGSQKLHADFQLCSSNPHVVQGSTAQFTILCPSILWA